MCAGHTLRIPVALLRSVCGSTHNLRASSCLRLSSAVLRHSKNSVLRASKWPHHAGKFILFQLERARAARNADGLEASLAADDYSSPEALAKLPLAERWIVSRLHQVCARRFV